MLGYPTKRELEEAWIIHKAHEIADRGEETFEDARTLAKIMVRNAVVYEPRFYRGGHLIRGFGFSVERIAEGYIGELQAGDPEGV